MAYGTRVMERRLAEWKTELDRIWSAHAPDYGEAVRLAQQIAGSDEEEMLRQAASQALPILRRAAEEDADHTTHEAARRRIAVIREVLSALTTPQFGRRTAALDRPGRRLLRHAHERAGPDHRERGSAHDPARSPLQPGQLVVGDRRLPDHFRGHAPAGRAESPEPIRPDG